MRALATQASGAYKEDDPVANLDGSFRLQLVAGRYDEALATLASLRTALGKSQVPSRAPWANVQYEVYARARIAEAGGLDLKAAYAEAFRARFASLDDWSAAQVARGLALEDPSDAQRDWQRELDARRTTDTVPLPDALVLVRSYLRKVVYGDLGPLASVALAEDDRRRYTTDTNILVKTPDGASICTFVMRPRSAPGTLPALLSFGIYVGSPAATLVDIRMSAANGFAGVTAFTRGKACSPDQPSAYTHDGGDAAAVVDWIAAQPWSDGRVGMYGGSYLGFAAWAAAKRMPKALKALMAMAPAGPGLDVPMEGNVFWNFVYPWPFYTLNKRTDDDATYNDGERWQRLNTAWYASGRAYRDLDAIDGTPNPTFHEWIAHPSYDDYWRAMIPYGDDFARVTIPVLLTAGYYYGGPGAATYYFGQLETHAPHAEHALVIGPYDHFGAQYGVVNLEGRVFDTVGGMPVDPVALLDLTELRYSWFTYILKGGPRPALVADKVNYEVTGANVWKHAPSFRAMGESALRFFLSPPDPQGQHQLIPSPTNGIAARLVVDLADRSDGARAPVGGGVMDEAIDTHNALSFVSAPLPRAVETSGLFTGHLDFVVNKRDVDFEIDLYEATPRGKYVQIGQYWTRASYMRDRSVRTLLVPGERQLVDFQSIRLMSRRLEAGSRIVAVLGVIKEPGRQINYGTGRDVSEETVQEVGPPVEIRWFGDSSLSLPVVP
jgi:putative CocE/NonD family hydrolase